MEMLQRNDLTDYWSALEGAGFYSHTDAGCLRFSDQGRLDFLQRQTTNDLGSLNRGNTVTTVLVSPTARILDVLRLIDEGENTLVLTLPGHGGNTLHYLTQRIFFMDKVKITDETREFSQIELGGPEANQVLRKLGLDSAPVIDEIIRVEWDGNPLWVIGTPGFSGEAFWLITPAACQTKFKQALLTTQAIELSIESYQILRVENGLPAAGAELTEEYTPLEVGLEQAVSGSKGCYPGQEVIARQVTYDKVTQRFVRLKLRMPAFPGNPLYFKDKLAGKITSTAVSPRFGPLALAVVKKQYLEPGTVLRTSEEGVEGVVEQR